MVRTRQAPRETVPAPSVGTREWGLLLQVGTHLFLGSKAQLLTPLKNRAVQVSLVFSDLPSYALCSCFIILLSIGLHSPGDSYGPKTDLSGE